MTNESTKSNNSTNSTTLKVKAPRLTVAEKRQKAAMEALKEQEAFEKSRSSIWLGIWISAMRMWLMFNEMPSDFQRKYQTTFSDVSINAGSEHIVAENISGSKMITKENLTLSESDRLTYEINYLLDLMVAFKQEENRLRLAELAKKQEIDVALAKLTAREIELLSSYLA